MTPEDGPGCPIEDIEFSIIGSHNNLTVAVPCDVAQGSRGSDVSPGEECPFQCPCCPIEDIEFIIGGPDHNLLDAIIIDIFHGRGGKDIASGGIHPF